MSLGHKILDCYLKCFPDVHDLFLNDPTFHMQVQVLRRILSTVEEAMQDEGIEEDVQRRILTRAVFGVPDVEAGINRLRTFRETVGRLSLPILPPERDT